MTLSESEVDEVVEEGFQHALAIAAQIGSATARVWKDHQERAHADTTRQGALNRLAFDSEKVAATTALAPTSKDQWWDAAGSKDIVDAYRIATAWKDHDPTAAAAEQNIRTQLQARYGVDINDVAPGGQRINAGNVQGESIDRKRSTEATKDAQGFAAVARAEYARADIANGEAAQERRDGPSALEEEWYREEYLTRDPAALTAEFKADRATAAADKHEKTGDWATEKSEAAYGTAEHRAAVEQQLVSAGVPDQAVKARLQGEKIQKYPITHAAAGKGAAAGTTRGPSAAQAQGQGKNRTRGR
jgi:hypothetical protein